MSIENQQMALRAIPMNLFPTLDSLDAVVIMAKSKLPLVCPNEMHSILMTFQNTLIKQLDSK